jgi:hypothetical protein
MARLLMVVLLALPCATVSSAQEKRLDPLIVSYSSFTDNLKQEVALTQAARGELLHRSQREINVR